MSPITIWVAFMVAFLLGVTFGVLGVFYYLHRAYIKGMKEGAREGMVKLQEALLGVVRK